MSTVNETRLSMVGPRRTRHNVKQSKTGCFSCRAQRKKCDEQKPTCGRCMRSRKTCEGFADNASPSRLSPVETQLLSSPCRQLSVHLKTDSAQSRFAQLGLEVLAQQTCRDAFGIDAKVWTCLLPQLSSVSPTVNGAVAALGATYEAVVLRPAHAIGTERSLAAIQYHKALALLQLDVFSQIDGPIPSFLASLLLAAVEVTSRHLINALVHLQGALTIMTECIYGSKHSPSACSSDSMSNDAELVATLDESHTLYLMAQALDVQTSTYVLSRRPQLSASLFTDNGATLGTLSDSLSLIQAQSELIPLLHACYHYASLASEYKYLPRADIPSQLALDQSRYIALLSQWVSRLDRRAPTIPSKQTCSSDDFGSSVSQQYALLVQRIQCISTLIYLSTILSYNEKSYDAFTSYFQQIVADAAILLESQSPGDCFSHPQNRFRILSPISQPLYLTAVKCRQGSIRRRAIQLLGSTGREGPWHGGIFQKFAQRVMEIEEEDVLQKGVMPQEKDTDGISVPEKMRLHGCGLESEAALVFGKGIIEAHFSRCVDAELMVTRSDIPWDSKENWEMWRENISI